MNIKPVSICLGLILSVSTSLFSQSFQSLFSEVAFDRNRAPKTTIGNIEVEPATGNLSVKIPLGPGISIRNLKYRPTLIGRYYPQAQRVKLANYRTEQGASPSSWYVSDVYFTEWYNVSNTGGFGFQSGGIIVPLGDPDAEAEWGDLHGTWVNNNSLAPIIAARLRRSYEQVASFSLPDGSSSSILSMNSLISSPQNATGIAPTPTNDQIKQILSKFGYSSQWRFASKPYYYSSNFMPEKHEMITHGSTGELVVGIQQEDVIQEYNPTINIDSKYAISLPIAHATAKAGGGSSNSRCVIPGTIVVIKNDILYEFCYSGVVYSPPVDYRMCFIRHSHYRLASMRNVYGDKIVFNQPIMKEGCNTIADLSPTINASIESKHSGSYPSVFISDGYVTYRSSGTNVPMFDFDSISNVESGAFGYQITSLKNIITGEKIDFKYSNKTFRVGGTATILSEIIDGSKSTKIGWNNYQYLRTRDEVGEWNGLMIDNPPAIADDRLIMPCEAMGVISVVEEEAGQTRSVGYTRVLPSVNLVSPSQWLSTEFYCSIKNIDGTKTKLTFVEPIFGKLKGSTTLEDFQILAYSKHLVKKEERFDENGNLIAIVDHPLDSLDVKSFTSPNGIIAYNPHPYFKTTEETIFENGVAISKIIKSINDWDVQNPGWKFEKNDGIFGGVSETKTTSRTFLWRPDLARVVVSSESSTEKPKSDWIYDENGRISDLTITGINSTANKLNLKYIYESSGVSGFDYFDGPTPGSIQVYGENLKLSGNVGVYYGLDKFGNINKIQLIGSTWDLKQNMDDFGRVLSQTDANGIIKTFVWDDAGRISSVSAPNEVTTNYIYDYDSKGVVIEQGDQRSHLRFNGFGELVREARLGNGTWSHRAIGYDQNGRKRWESGWRPEQGLDSGWTSELAPDDVLQGGTSGYWERVCTRWVFDRILREEKCMDWKDVWVPATGGQFIYKNSTHYTYDAQGRLMKVRDPNGVITASAYAPGAFGIRKTVTRGAGADASVTHFETDGFGRLRAAINESEQGPLLTSFTYDLADRIKQVDQWGAASMLNGIWVGSGQRQVRSWAYNPMGWLQQLTQPESGTTTYSDFDVAGRPWRTNYNGRIIDSTFDPLGRVLSIRAQDGTVDQSYAYDEAGRGASKGKLTSARSGQVHRGLFFSGLNGRLSHIERKIDGFTFRQEISYDVYGNISTRRYPSHLNPENLGISQVMSYDATRSLPTSSGYGATATLFGYDPIHWSLTQVDTPFGPNISQTRFSYGEDQKRLNSLWHGASIWRGMQEGPSLNLTYVYDDQGRLLKDGEDRYTYDRLGRVKTALIKDPFGSQAVFQSFDFDAFGNRIKANTGTVTNWIPGNPEPTSLTVSSSVRAGLINQVANVQFAGTRPELLRNQMPAATSQGYATGATYDAQGNLVQVFPRVGASGEAISMSYDALGRVSSMAYGPSATRRTEQYLYDDEGLRIRIWDGSKYRYNVYNEARQLIAQYEKTPTGSLTWKKDILYVGTKEIAEVSSDGKTWVTLCDHLGSPRIVWDGSTAPVQQKFLPFGEALHDPATAGKFAKGFTNHEQTDPSGLIYMQARFYLPMYGRFASPDPARDQHFEETQSWNIYSYVQNNPVMMTDPTGMWLLGPDWGGLRQKVAEVSSSVARWYGGHVQKAQQLLAKDPQVAAAFQPGRWLLIPSVGNGSAPIAPTPGPALVTNEGVVIAGASSGPGVVAIPSPAAFAQTGGPYENIPDPPNAGEGRDFTARQKREAKSQNAERNGGEMRSDGDGGPLKPAQQSQKGVTPDPREAHVDHATAKANGGTNTSGNMRVISREENLRKGARNVNQQ